MDKLRLALYLTLLVFISGITTALASPDVSIQNLKAAYPEQVKEVTSRYIAWNDGTHQQLGDGFAFFNWFRGNASHNDQKSDVISDKDISHARFVPFFQKMYGRSAKDVSKHLVTVYWMPNVFGKRYPLRVTTINGVDQKLRRISANLEKLPPQYFKYLERPGGSYYWRKIEGESSLSSHSFGIAIDINLRYSNYWLWDYQKTNKPISELRNHRLSYQNRIPMEIVRIFENEGFYWGGRWYFYDTMHFEYRPDLLLSAEKLEDKFIKA